MKNLTVKLDTVLVKHWLRHVFTALLGHALFFYLSHTDFTVMQIEIETRILSGGRRALNDARAGQALLDLGEYLCCSQNTRQCCCSLRACAIIPSRQGCPLCHYTVLQCISTSSDFRFLSL